MTRKFDAIIVGGGHNGLTCGAYLSKAGLKTLVLERRDIVGGAAVTEEFSPGFRASTYSFIMGHLHPKVIAELELEKFGLDWIEVPEVIYPLYDDDCCPSSNKWNRRSAFVKESFAHQLHITRRVVDSANDVSRWSFS